MIKLLLKIRLLHKALLRIHRHRFQRRPGTAKMIDWDTMTNDRYLDMLSRCRWLSRDEFRVIAEAIMPLTVIDASQFGTMCGDSTCRADVEMLSHTFKGRCKRLSYLMSGMEHAVHKSMLNEQIHVKYGVDPGFLLTKIAVMGSRNREIDIQRPAVQANSQHGSRKKRLHAAKRVSGRGLADTHRRPATGRARKALRRHDRFVEQETCRAALFPRRNR